MASNHQQHISDIKEGISGKHKAQIWEARDVHNILV
jgi:hypothetical protein